MADSRLTPADLRSARWFAPDDLRSFGHRSRAAQLGMGRGDYHGKPVIGVVNTWSDLNPCHGHLRERAQDVKRGVWQAGGFPVELPVLSLAENFQKPTTMLYRNLLAMEVEELLRSYPVDGCVLLGGCDKTAPGLVMGGHQHGPAGPVPAGRADGEGGTSAGGCWAAAATCGSRGTNCGPAASPPATGGRWRRGSPARPAPA